MQVGVLGPLEVAGTQGVVRLSRAQERRLLAALVVNRNESVSTGTLVEALWPGETQAARPARALRTIVSRLRDAIGDDHIVTAPAGYRLLLEDEALDAARFERLVAEARAALAADPKAALAAFEEALALWRGAAYEEFAHEPFARAEAVRLEELRVSTVEARMDAGLALGHHEELVGELQGLVERHPFSERLREQLAIALYRSGRQADALASLRAYRELLVEELGLDPSPALQDLEWRVLAHQLEPAGGLHAPDAATAPAAAGDDAPSLEDELGLAPTRLIGRDDVAGKVLAALGEARLVTLVGPGGVGKTRLAAHAAGQARPAFADGVASCSLAPVGDGAAVPAALATALGVRQRRHRSLEDSLVDGLRPRHVLLLLDNCEHVVDVAARLVDLLLRRCPRLSVLATSREVLGLAGERLVEVPPLPVPASGGSTEGSAVELFRQRAAAAGVELATDGETEAAVFEICRRLDGLPLAVEIAAAHARALQPNDIVTRLGTPTALAHTRRRGIADRHRSLQAVTDWSYALLADAERALFDVLSVFAGSFDWQAAIDVAVATGLDAEQVPDLLAALVDKSMLAVRPGPGPTRYVLLETLRSYGGDQLARRGLEEACRHAHARHYTVVVERAERELGGPDEPLWMKRLAHDMDNLREARRWSLDHDLDLAVRLVAGLSWFRFRTLQTELELWAEESADRAPDHRLTPVLLGSAALGAWSRGELIRARDLAQRALAASPGPEQRQARDALAAILLVEGNRDSLHHYEHASLLAREAGDRYHEAWCLGGQAIALAYLGRGAESRDRLHEAEAVARDLRCPSLVAWVLYVRGECLVESDPERALDLLDRSEALAGEVGHELVATVAGISAITVRARRGNVVESLPRFRALLERLDRIGNRTQLWMMLRSLIYVLAREGRVEPAAVLHAALEASATAVDPFGPDRERLDEAARTVAAVAGAAQVETWTNRGRAMDDREAIAYAIAAIDSMGEAP